MFPLVVRDFNERSNRVLSVFASNSIKACPIGINLIEYVNDEGDATIAMQSFVENAKNNVSAVVGPIYSSVAKSLGVTASALNIPMVSNWATSSALSNKRIYKYFMRTVVSDGQGAIALALLFKQLKIKRLGMLYVQDDYGTGWRDSLTTACGNLGLSQL
jgi:ABC-type branched-subunit amino acid transport system substrate-binding protein